MTPYYQHNGITIYCGDLLETLAEILDESIDLIVTSPPYNCRKDYGLFDDQMPWPEYYDWIGKVLDQLYRVLRIGGTLAVNIPGVVRFQRDHKFAHTWSGYDPDYETHRGAERAKGRGRVEPVGFNLYSMMASRDPHVREPIIWVKGSREGEAICTTYQMGCDSDPYMRPAHEMILLGSKGRWFHRGATGRRGGDACPFLDYTKDVWHITPESSRTHPAIFPLEIPLRLARLFIHSGNAVILDPFMGEGSTLQAAKSVGVSAIGIEINPRYCKTAADNLRQVGFGDIVLRPSPRAAKPQPAQLMLDESGKVW